MGVSERSPPRGPSLSTLFTRNCRGNYRVSPATFCWTGAAVLNWRCSSYISLQTLICVQEPVPIPLPLPNRPTTALSDKLRRRGGRTRSNVLRPWKTSVTVARKCLHANERANGLDAIS